MGTSQGVGAMEPVQAKDRQKTGAGRTREGVVFALEGLAMLSRRSENRICWSGKIVLEKLLCWWIVHLLPPWLRVWPVEACQAGPAEVGNVSLSLDVLKWNLQQHSSFVSLSVWSLPPVPPCLPLPVQILHADGLCPAWWERPLASQLLGFH